MDATTSAPKAQDNFTHNNSSVMKTAFNATHAGLKITSKILVNIAVTILTGLGLLLAGAMLSAGVGIAAGSLVAGVHFFGPLGAILFIPGIMLGMRFVDPALKIKDYSLGFFHLFFIK